MRSNSSNLWAVASITTAIVFALVTAPTGVLGTGSQSTATPASAPQTPTPAAAATPNPPPKPPVDEDDLVQMGAVRGFRLGDVEWGPGPFPGTKMALLVGDPKTGMHHAYVKIADGTAIPPHWHSADEYVTVVSGMMLFGVGEKADRDAARLFSPGAFLHVPARTPHYVFAKGEVVISQTRSGPADIHLVGAEAAK
jgi:quercetin dioxygenase-like cupin family protein